MFTGVWPQEELGNAGRTPPLGAHRAPVKAEGAVQSLLHNCGPVSAPVAALGARVQVGIFSEVLYMSSSCAGLDCSTQGLCTHYAAPSPAGQEPVDKCMRVCIHICATCIPPGQSLACRDTYDPWINSSLARCRDSGVPCSSCSHDRLPPSGVTYAAKGYFDALVKMGELASESQGSKELGESRPMLGLAPGLEGTALGGTRLREGAVRVLGREHGLI